MPNSDDFLPKSYNRQGGKCCETCKHFSGDMNFYAGGDCGQPRTTNPQAPRPCVDNGGLCDNHERGE